MLFLTSQLCRAQSEAFSDQRESLRHSFVINSGWARQQSGTSFTCFGISFRDKTNGFVVCREALILGTTDGGDTWVDRSNWKVPNRELKAVTFVNSNRAFACGGGSSIYRTTDGGANWTSQGFWPMYGFTAISFCDTLHGCAVGWGGTILRTTDGGDHWVQQTSGTTEWLLDVDLQSPEICTVVLQYGVLRTTDGGNTWVMNRDVGGNGISFTDNLVGTIIGGYGMIFRTTDGGNTWTQQASGTTIHLQAVSFSDSSNGTVVGPDGLILRTTDGGDHWTTQSSGTIAWLFDVQMIDANTVTVVGDTGIILRTTTGGVTWVEEPKSAPSLFHLGQNYPNPVAASTNIPFSITKQEHVTLSVHDILGRQVAVLVDEEREMGSHAVPFDATGLASGMYFYVLRTGSVVETKKMLVVGPE